MWGVLNRWKLQKAVRADPKDWLPSETTCYFALSLTDSIPALMGWEEPKFQSILFPSQTLRFPGQGRRMPSAHGRFQQESGLPPLPPGGRRGQDQTENREENVFTLGLCGTDRWLPHAAPPRDPQRCWGPTLLGPPGRGQGSVLLSGAFPADAQVSGEPGSGWGGENLKPPRRQRGETERGVGGCSATRAPSPRATAEETPARPPPSAHGPCSCWGLWESSSADSAAHLVQGVQAEAAILLLSLLLYRRPPRGGAPRGTRALPPPPPGPRGLLPPPPPSASRSPDPRRQSPRLLRPQPSPSASTSVPAHPVTPSQPPPPRPRERRRRRSGEFRCGLAARRQIRFLLGLPSPPLIGWGGDCVTKPPRLAFDARYAGRALASGRTSPANNKARRPQRERSFKLAPPRGAGRGYFQQPVPGLRGAPNLLGSCSWRFTLCPDSFFSPDFHWPNLRPLLILFVIGRKGSTSPGGRPANQASPAFSPREAMRALGFEFGFILSHSTHSATGETKPLAQVSLEKARLCGGALRSAAPVARRVPAAPPATSYLVTSPREEAGSPATGRRLLFWLAGQDVR